MLVVTGGTLFDLERGTERPDHVSPLGWGDPVPEYESPAGWSTHLEAEPSGTGDAASDDGPG